MQTFLAAILMATLTLAAASANISISDSIIPSTATSTTSSTATSITLEPNHTPNPNDTAGCSPCYCDGETWDNLGSWNDINRALQNSGIVRVTTIPHGYHVSYPAASTPKMQILTNLLQVNENIAVNSHCFIFEIGVNKGNALNMNPGQITDLLSAARARCAHGGRWDLNFVASDGDIQGKGWVKTDPQANKDCS